MTAPIAIIMGSQSDWETMRHAAETLTALGIDCEKRIVSAHRTPEAMTAYGRDARSRGLKAIIAGAGGAAHLPGMLAAVTPLPVIGVPVPLRFAASSAARPGSPMLRTVRGSSDTGALRGGAIRGSSGAAVVPLRGGEACS